MSPRCWNNTISVCVMSADAHGSSGMRTSVTRSWPGKRKKSIGERESAIAFNQKKKFLIPSGGIISHPGISAISKDFWVILSPSLLRRWSPHRYGILNMGASGGWWSMGWHLISRRIGLSQFVNSMGYSSTGGSMDRFQHQCAECAGSERGDRRDRTGGNLLFV